jgi:two-component system LytT family response regulator
MDSVVIKTLLVDDEPLARVGVRSRLNAHPEFQVIGECDRGGEALIQAHMLQPDLIFLDIEMSGGSGLEIAPMLQLEAQPAIVFLTAHRQYAVEAFEVEAVDYLLKPLDDVRLEAALVRVKLYLSLRAGQSPIVPLKMDRENAPPDERIAVTDRKRTRILRMGDVEWIGAAGDYTELHVQGATHLLRETLSSFLDKRCPHSFCRIHRSAAVNLPMVSELVSLRNNDLLVRLNSGKILRASRTFSQGLREALRIA